MRVLLWILGMMSAANGVWMLATPAAWYHGLPAGVPDTGPLNVHFVRDVGSAFATFAWACASQPSFRAFASRPYSVRRCSSACTRPYTSPIWWRGGSTSIIGFSTRPVCSSRRSC